MIFVVPRDDRADVNTSLRRVLIFNAAFIPIGAQIVSVPARLVNESADTAVKRVLCWLAGGYALVFVTVNLGVYFLARQ